MEQAKEAGRQILAGGSADKLYRKIPLKKDRKRPRNAYIKNTKR
jgi:hypothetical protein